MIAVILDKAPSASLSDVGNTVIHDTACNTTKTENVGSLTNFKSRVVSAMIALNSFIQIFLFWRDEATAIERTTLYDLFLVYSKIQVALLQNHAETLWYTFPFPLL